LGVHGDVFEIRTKGENDILDISGDVARAIAASGLKDGIACVFVSGSTGAITTVEYEPGLLADLPDALERLVPKNMTYQHHLRWHDGNGHSHVRASIMGPGLTVPFRDGRPVLGTWQQIVFVEMDVRGRSRQIHVQLVGE
jgi:secondary thiamine-phosphate synthase enzyme